MKKKIFFAIATGFFAVATVFNMNALQGGGGDISLDAIAVMAQAQNENDGNPLRAIRYDELNNSNYGGLFNYPDLAGSPQFCTLYAKYDASGRIVQTSETKLEAQGGFTISLVTGVKEKCPKKGNGCTVYSCRQTN
ncbi:hypothetical protein [Alkaliflexus imshenetskii]|uniref:hypothetical protein n=1 Tax=Alkaliflexus imshenetskii TaxID=286730 RepID=UPI00047E22DD|nr:hypothetical protein [Alkaliflexus imshenetskii]